MSTEGAAHSDYLFHRDQTLKKGFDSSNKNYRIIPEMSKSKKKLVDTQLPPGAPDATAVSAKQTDVEEEEEVVPEDTPVVSACPECDECKTPIGLLLFASLISAGVSAGIAMFIMKSRRSEITE